jgi:Ribbon-helix-helix protein, copG family
MTLSFIIFQSFMRTIIDIPIESLKHLDRWASERNISRAEAIRRAVADLLDRTDQPKNTGFGLWAQGQPVPADRDGLRLQQAMRDEWPE